MDIIVGTVYIPQYLLVVKLFKAEINWRREWQPTPILRLENPWTEEPGGLQSMGLQRVGHDRASEQRECNFK